MNGTKTGGTDRSDHTFDVEMLCEDVDLATANAIREKLVGRMVTIEHDGLDYEVEIVSAWARGALDAMEPHPRVTIKLGSLARHAEEALSGDGHHMDQVAIEGVLADPEVQAWMKAADKRALLPVKRKDG